MKNVAPMGQSGEKLILFDGVCNLCNSSVNFIIDRDINRNFKFSSLQSGPGQRVLGEMGHDTENFDSIVLVEGDKVYDKSTAALRVARDLAPPWPMLYIFIIVPKFIRDSIYGLIAKNRYKWFGKSNQCRIPSPGLKDRFLAIDPVGTGK